MFIAFQALESFQKTPDYRLSNYLNTAGLKTPEQWLLCSQPEFNSIPTYPGPLPRTTVFLTSDAKAKHISKF